MIPLICDVDGVMTTGKVGYPSPFTREFSVRDGHGFQLLKERTNIMPIVMSGECDASIIERVEKLGVTRVLGTQDKMMSLLTLTNYPDASISYGKYIAISDDIPDLNLLQNATLAFCPADAEDEIKAIDGIIVLSKKGGEGCVREAINMILTQPWIHELFKGALQIT